MVDWVSGVIRVNGDLDLGKKKYYDLTVRATVRFLSRINSVDVITL